MTTPVYPSIASWTDRVDGVNYVYAIDPNSIIAEVLAIAKDLVGTSGLVGGLSQGGTSFYTRWTQEHNSTGTHKAISAPTTGDTINGLIINSGALSGVTTLGLSGAITGATSTNTINGLVISSGALSSVTTLGLSGAITGLSSASMNHILKSTDIDGFSVLGVRNESDWTTRILQYGSTATSTYITGVNKAGLSVVDGTGTAMAVGITGNYPLYFFTNNTVQFTINNDGTGSFEQNFTFRDDVIVAGTTGKTFKSTSDAAAAPSTTAAQVPTNSYVGAGQSVMTMPSKWLLVNLNGTEYKVPCYS